MHDNDFKADQCKRLNIVTAGHGRKRSAVISKVEVVKVVVPTSTRWEILSGCGDFIVYCMHTRVRSTIFEPVKVQLSAVNCCKVLL